MSDNVLDRLSENEITIASKEDIIIPDKCFDCKNHLICTVVPTLVGMSKLGLVIILETCPYYADEKK